MPAVVPDTFYHVIEIIYEHVHDMLAQQCNEALDEMKALGSEIGSYTQVVSAGDGTWLQRVLQKSYLYITKLHEQWIFVLCLPVHERQ